MQKPDCTGLKSKWKVKKKDMMCDNSFLKCFLLLASVTLYFPGFPTHLAAFLNSPLLGYSLLTFKYLSSTEYRYPNSALYLSLLPEGFSYHM